jgi:exoribonuclease-2
MTARFAVVPEFTPEVLNTVSTLSKALQKDLIYGLRSPTCAKRSIRLILCVQTQESGQWYKALITFTNEAYRSILIGLSALVIDIILMAVQAAARFTCEQNLPFPFTTQSPPEIMEQPQDPAAMFAYRKRFKRSRMKSVPGPHAGLGLEFYAQVTSPLRRYLDLVAHQQIHACLRGETPLVVDELMLRVGSAEAVIGEVRRAEHPSNTHWKLVYLQRHPNWCGTGIVVEKRGSRATALIPDLGLDAPLYVGGGIKLNSEIKLSVANIGLPTLTVHFQPNQMS